MSWSTGSNALFKSRKGINITAINIKDPVICIFKKGSYTESVMGENPLAD